MCLGRSILMKQKSTSAQPAGVLCYSLHEDILVDVTQHAHARVRTGLCCSVTSLLCLLNPLHSCLPVSRAQVQTLQAREKVSDC